MNNWTTLNPLPAEPYAAGKEFEKLRTGFNKEIATLTTARAKYDADARALKDADLADLDEAKMELLQRLPTTKAGLLRDEAVMRRRMAEAFYPARTKEREKAREAAEREAADAADELTAALVRLGYIDGTDESTGQPGIAPAFYHLHPRVRESRRRADAMLNLILSRDDRDQNDSALADVEEKLRQIVARAVA